MRRGILLCLVVVLTVTVVATGCGSKQPAGQQAPPEEGKTMKIGVPTLISGPGAPMGTDIVAGIGMAIEKINAEGGVLGKPLEAVYADIKGCSAEDCTLAAELMERAGVVANFPGAFFGPAGVHAFGKYDPPMFHGSATKELVDAVVENMNEYRNVFQICASEAAYGPNAYDIMTSKIPYKLPNKKVALLGGDITYDMLIQKSFKEMCVKNGWEVVLDDTYPYGTTEFGAQLSKIRAEKPAIIFGCLTSVDSAVAFMNQFLANPTDSLIYIQWSPASPEFIKLLGDKANGILWQSLIACLPTPENQKWVEEFRAKYGRDPGATWPAVMEDTLRLWKAAVETVGNAKDYPKIYEYLENLSQHPYKGRCGTYGMDPKRHEGLTGDEWLPIHMYQIQDQKNHLLFLGSKAQPGENFIVPPWIKNR